MRLPFLLLGLTLPLLALPATANDEPSSVTVAAPATDSISIEPFENVVSSDATPVVINVSGKRFRIPRNYLRTAAPIGRYVIFELIAIYPGFHGVEDASAPEFHFDKLPDAPPNVVISYHLDVGPWNKEINERVIGSIPKSEVTTAMNGLVQAKSPAAGWEYYVHLSSSGEDPIVIGCLVKCSVIFDLAPGFGILYLYDRTLLPQWQQIHEGMTRLMRSFVEN